MAALVLQADGVTPFEIVRQAIFIGLPEAWHFRIAHCVSDRYFRSSLTCRM